MLRLDSSAETSSKRPFRLIAVISNLVLGSFSGMISNLIGCMRNILCYKNKLGLKEKVIICIVLIVFTVYFNNLGFIGYLPLLSTVLYTMFIDIKNITAFKWLIVVTLLMWVVHDLYIKSYVYVLFDLGAIITNLISIIEIKILDKKKSSN